ncbi:MAG: TraR/DksA family transcriptional regulator [Acidobacteriota bacterium]|jgi:DnaK suppressor protein
MDKKSLNHFEELLKEKRSELQQAYQEKLSRSGDAGSDGALDSVDEASANYNKEFWYFLSDTDRKIMRQIDESLRRIADGSYGICTNCEEAIQKKRLQAVPWARHCLACQDLQDRGLLEE